MFSSCPFPDEYAYVCQIWSRSVQLFGIFAILLYVWPLTPSKYPLGIQRLILLADVHSQMNLHMCVKFGPDRSSALRQDRRWLLMLVRLLAVVGADSRKNTPKNNILYIENYNAGSAILTTTSLTFFTSIFLAFRSSLVEVFMVMCWHATTELYRY